jgi:hypothetical protein
MAPFASEADQETIAARSPEGRARTSPGADGGDATLMSPSAKLRVWLVGPAAPPGIFEMVPFRESLAWLPVGSHRVTPSSLAVPLGQSFPIWPVTVPVGGSVPSLRIWWLPPTVSVKVKMTHLSAPESSVAE